MPPANATSRSLVVFASLPLASCLLNAVPEEMLTGGGPGDHAVIADAGQVDGADLDRALFADRATLDRAVSHDASIPDRTVTDTMASADRNAGDLTPHADSSTGLDHGSTDRRADDGAHQDAAMPETSGHDSSAQDGSASDSAVRDSTVRDSAVRDSAVRDSAIFDTAVGDTAVRDTALRDLPMPDVTGRVVLFSDDFESGSLTSWALSQPNGGMPWSAASLDPASGIFGAQVEPRETTDPATTMERAVSTVGRSGIHFEYDRKLVELDNFDEFQALVYDGASWLVVEQTASLAVNDAAYVHKSFSLPSVANNPAFKIRFDCTAGMVGESCRVDNVVVWAEQ